MVCPPPIFRVLGALVLGGEIMKVQRTTKTPRHQGTELCDCRAVTCLLFLVSWCLGGETIKVLLTLCAAAATISAAEPIRLHPDNPHYFLFRGKPTVLVTSGEHYGAVINLDFDYKKYLAALEAAGLNHTRTFAGAYREIPGSFNIPNNTLAPEPDRFICPWPRTETPGAKDGGNKFDLTKWNEAYFRRLRAFMEEASRRGIVVEINLFCPFYEDVLWEVNPMNAVNNVNGIGGLQRTEALNLKDTRLLAVQEAMVRRIVTELKNFGNLYYEICNEPYFGGVTLEWQAHISKVIDGTEGSFPARHLISQNIANGSVRVDHPNPLVSLFNFHYSRPPESVALNYEFGRGIGNNETGFDGLADATYRIQGWDFLMAGGALYNNLDYSFTAGREDGSFVVPPGAPGGGSPALRRQLKILRDFLESLDFIRMAPASGIIRGGVPPDASARALAEAGRTYAVYLHHGRIDAKAKPRYQVPATPQRVTLALGLPAGSYAASWLNTKTGEYEKTEKLAHGGGAKDLVSPSYTEDIALVVRAVK